MDEVIGRTPQVTVSRSPTPDIRTSHLAFSHTQCLLARRLRARIAGIVGKRHGARGGEAASPVQWDKAVRRTTLDGKQDIAIESARCSCTTRSSRRRRAARQGERRRS